MAEKPDDLDYDPRVAAIDAVPVKAGAYGPYAKKVVTPKTLVAATALKLSSASTDRQSVRIFNNSGTLMYISAVNTLTATTGYPVPTQTEFFEEGSVDDYWGFSAAGGDVRVMETFG